MFRPTLLALVLGLVLGLPTIASAQTDDSTVAWVQGASYRLKVAIYKASAQTTTPTLVVVLHGDSPYSKPDYQDRFGAVVARTYPNTIVAAILRPGYTDPAGHTSEGERGESIGDNWNIQNTDAIASVIETLREQFHASRVVLIGHSGGAALSANILGRHPGLATAALLVACPCDVSAWRAHMYRTTGIAVFNGTISALSAIDLIPSTSPAVRLHMIVGELDDVAPMQLTLDYASAAQKHGLTVTTQILAQQGHNILLLPDVLAALSLLLPQAR